jgi:pSer/pThr/pTyr-binding forkhead associated (FHA) protein
MAEVTLQILDGVDRGKVFQHLDTPVSIGREEGNTIQLNDERVSRYHAKIQEDQGQLVLTDLESTNGTRVHGEPVPLTILRLGDRISVGRSVLLVGSPSELDDLMGSSTSKPSADGRTINSPNELIGDKTRPASAVTDYPIDAAGRSEELKFQLNFHDGGVSPIPQPPADGESTPRAVPGLPSRLSPAQAAQLAEMLLYFHQRLGAAIEEATEQGDDGNVVLSRATWQRILRVEMEIARFHYRIGHPE